MIDLSKFAKTDPTADQEAPALSNERRQFVKTLSVGTAALTTGLAASNTFAQSEPGIEGQEAPELALDYWIDANGEPGSFSMKESRGKWVFLKFFQNWCPGCHKSGFPTLKAFSDEFHEHPDVAIAAIQTVFEGFSSNTQDDVRKLQLRYELPITMGHNPGDADAEGHSLPSTMINYRSGGTPWLVLVNPEGVVVYNHFHVKPEDLIAYVTAQVS